MLFARKFTLRNCGRFTVVESDFGSHYRTYTHVTSEAFYASLTRGVTWRPHVIAIKDDPASFSLSYDVQALPLWFVPGVFSVEGGDMDTSIWNVVHEFYPTTSKSYVLEHGEVVEKDRPPHVPAYGTIESIVPDQRLVTCAFSAERRLLDPFMQGQTFLLGKKRTMMQITDISPIIQGAERHGICTTGWLELPPAYGGYFQSFEVAAATLRYLIMRGTTRKEGDATEFAFDGDMLCLPDFFLDQIPVRF